MAAINITGTVVKCDVRKTVANDWNYTHKYSPNTEYYTVCLNIELRGIDGTRYFFNSPSFTMRATSCPGATVVTYSEDNKDSGSWMKETEGNAVATAEKANENSLTPLVKVGEVITIRASVKAVKPGYTSLNRVKRVL